MLRPFLCDDPETDREVLSAGAGLAAEVALETGGELGESQQQSRPAGTGSRSGAGSASDKVAIGSGIFIIFLSSPLPSPARRSPSRWLGHGPNDIFPSTGVDTRRSSRPGRWHTVTDARDGKEQSSSSLGGADTLGRDEFLRLLYGARVSLEVAVGATLS